MAEKTQTRRGPLGWVKRHKKLTIFLVIVLVAALVLVNVRGKTDKAATGSYQFVRTTVLTKTTLSDTVSVTGTVAVVEPAAKALTLSESVRSIASSNAGILFRFIKAPFCGGRHLPSAACTCRNYATVSHSITNTTFATVAFFIVLESGVTMAA